MISLGLTPLDPQQLAASLLAVGNGEYVVSLPDGSVLSCQPKSDGSFDKWETRAAGSAGAYERCTQSGGYIVFKPTTQVLVFSFAGTVPF